MKLILLLVYLFMTYVNACTPMIDCPCDIHSCGDDSECSDSSDDTSIPEGEYTCECDSGIGEKVWNGPILCPCDQEPCGFGQICAVSSSGYTCACDESTGFKYVPGQAECGKMRCDDANGDGTTGDAVDCGSNAICENDSEIVGYICTCESGYTGSSPFNAPATCFPTCDIADCGANAICSDTETGHTCECDDGFVFDSGDCIESEPDACAKDEYVKNNTCEKCGAISGNKAGDPVSGEDTACDVKAWFVVLMSVLGVGAVALTVFLVQYYAPERAKRFIYNPV